jgi:cobalt-zinc-cadmium efflux system membrane fusion protein
MDQVDTHALLNRETEEGHVARPGRRLPSALQVIFILGGAGLLAAWLLFSHLMGQKTEAPVAQEAASSSDSFKPTPTQWAGFKTAEARLTAFADTQTTDGKIALDDDLTTSVFSPYSGRVTKLFVRAGDQVKAGDPLLAMQASEFVQASNDLIAALATDRTAKAQLTLAGTTEKRQHDLFLAQGGSLKDWQQSQGDLANADGTFNSAEVALGAVRNRLRILGKSDRDIAAMEKSSDPTRFSPEAIVYAPISGTITQRQIGLGQNIVNVANGGSTPAFTIGNLNRVWLVANAREVDAPQIHVGDEAEVKVLAFPEQVFKARITYVAASIDPVTHRLPIHAEIDNAEGTLKPEMFATFRIVTGKPTNAPAVPESAIVYDAEGAHVWLARADKSLAIRQVKLGRQQSGLVEVLDGLKPGDNVVTAGAVFIDRAAQAD